MQNERALPGERRSERDGCEGKLSTTKDSSIMGRCRWKLVPVSVAALSVLLAACAAGAEQDLLADASEETPTADEATLGAEESPSDGPDQSEGQDPAGDIYAELAQMPYSERVDYLYEQAQEEGEVVLYSTTSTDTLRDWQDDFMEQYPGVEMQTLRAGASDMYTRLSMELNAGYHTVDVVQSAAELKFMNDDGFLAELHGAMIPENYPDKGIGDWWVSLGVSPFAISYNTDLLSAEEAPQSYEELTEEKWRGKVGLDAGPSQWVTALVAEWGEEETADYLRRLVDNDPVIRNGHTNLTTLLAAGEFPVAAELYLHTVERYIVDDDAPLDWNLADPIPNAGGAVSITRNAPNPHAAALLMHYMMSERGQQVRVESGRLTLHPDVEPRFPRTAEVASDDRLVSVSPEFGHEALKTAEKLIADIIAPAAVSD